MRQELTNWRQFRHHRHMTDRQGDVIMVDAPAPEPTHLKRAIDYYTHNLAPTIEPALRRGIKRTADHLIVARDRIVEQYVEIRRSTDDGLSIKRFKRLPIDPSVATTKAVLTNLLPVDFLKALPNDRYDHFRWTNDVLAYLHPGNHIRVGQFIEGLIEDAYRTNFIHLDSETYTDSIDPRNVPAPIAALIKRSGKSGQYHYFPLTNPSHPVHNTSLTSSREDHRPPSQPHDGPLQT